MVYNSISKAIPAGTTRARVAQVAGISRVHLQRIIAGKQQPTIAIALRLSAILQTRIDLLFYLDDEGMRAGDGIDGKDWECGHMDIPEPLQAGLAKFRLAE